MASPQSGPLNSARPVSITFHRDFPHSLELPIKPGQWTQARQDELDAKRRKGKSLARTPKERERFEFIWDPELKVYLRETKQSQDGQLAPVVKLCVPPQLLLDLAVYLHSRLHAQDPRGPLHYIPRKKHMHELEPFHGLTLDYMRTLTPHCTVCSDKPLREGEASFEISPRVERLVIADKRERWKSITDLVEGNRTANSLLRQSSNGSNDSFLWPDARRTPQTSPRTPDTVPKRTLATSAATVAPQCSTDQDDDVRPSESPSQSPAANAKWTGNDWQEHLRSKYEHDIAKITDEYAGCQQEMEDGLVPVDRREDVWHRHVKLALSMLRSLAWATIACGHERAAWDEADVLYLDQDELKQMLKEKKPLLKPVVIPAGAEPQTRDPDLDGPDDMALLKAFIYDHKPLQTQNLNRPDLHGPTRSSSTAELRQILNTQNPPRLRHFSRPKNWLDIHMADAPITNAILKCHKFSLIDRLINEQDRQAADSGGKRLQVQQTVDVADCRGWAIAAERGAVSKPHLDSLGHTIVRAVNAPKMWLCATPQGDAKFQVEGSSWIPGPGDMRLVLLEPGDEFFMPIRSQLVHAPITFHTCAMIGTMAWSVEDMPEIVDRLTMLLELPDHTNEPAQGQLRTLLPIFDKAVMKGNDRIIPQSSSINDDYRRQWQTAFTKYKKAASCGCKNYANCGNPESDCPCAQNFPESADGTGSHCAAWCHSHKSCKPKGKEESASGKKSAPKRKAVSKGKSMSGHKSASRKETASRSEPMARGNLASKRKSIEASSGRPKRACKA